jgi:hypothetical protein
VIAAAAIHATLAAASVAAAPAQVSLTASPTHVTLSAGGQQVVHVAALGHGSLSVQARVAGFALDLRGRPRIVSASDAAPWLSVRPRRIVIGRHGGQLTVSSRRPLHARPGDTAPSFSSRRSPRPRAASWCACASALPSRCASADASFTACPSWERACDERAVHACSSSRSRTVAM